MEKNNSQGFTLFELIAVLVIIGVVSTLALPRMFNSLTHVELKNAARQTVVLLNRARDMAYFQRMKVWVRFDSDKNRILAFKEDPLENKEQENIDGMAYDFPQGVSLQAEGSIQILFSSAGTSTGGTLNLENNRGRVYKIRVDIVTGHAWIAN